jgi:hypothetical protein
MVRKLWVGPKLFRWDSNSSNVKSGRVKNCWLNCKDENSSQQRAPANWYNEGGVNGE